MLTFEEIVRTQVYRVIPEQISACSTIIDLGANIGLASLYLASCFSGSRIVAVEPNPDTYQVLTTNLEGLRRSGRCQTIQGAVWSASRRLQAASVGDPEHYSAFAVQESRGSDIHDVITGFSIRQLIQISGFQFVDLLKVDVEGAEVELFRGDLNWLTNVGAIAIEFHKDARAECSFDLVMKDFGFSIVSDAAHTVIARNRARLDSR